MFRAVLIVEGRYSDTLRYCYAIACICSRGMACSDALNGMGGPDPSRGGALRVLPSYRRLCLNSPAVKAAGAF